MLCFIVIPAKARVRKNLENNGNEALASSCYYHLLVIFFSKRVQSTSETKVSPPRNTKFLRSLKRESRAFYAGKVGKQNFYGFINRRFPVKPGMTGCISLPVKLSIDYQLSWEWQGSFCFRF